jgi:hypothetical protein
MVHEIKILILEVVAEVEEEVVEDIQIGGIIIQIYNVIIVKSLVILLQIVLNTNLKTNFNFAKKKTDSEKPALLLACGKFDGNNSSTWYLDT